MKNIVKTLFVSFCISGSMAAVAAPETVVTDKNNVYEGYIVKKVWLSHYAVPTVTISGQQYSPSSIPAELAKSTAVQKMQVSIGVERKRPFALVCVPAYSYDAAGNPRMLDRFDIEISEAAANTHTTAARTTADVTTSALATGTWYKIGVTATGFHKIDASLLSAMGVDPSTVNPANIRVFGNGGHMLSEANYIDRPADLVENALVMSDNGDNVFSSGEYAMFYAEGPMGWDIDTTKKMFTHVKNLYSDTAYYFLTFDKGAGLRVAQQDAQPVAGAPTVSTYDYYDVHDIDLVNPGAIGKTWYGENFNQLAGTLSQNFNFDVGAAVSNVHLRASVGVKGAAGSYFTFSVNGSPTDSIIFTGGITDQVAMLLQDNEWDIPVSGASVSVNVKYWTNNSTNNGYLDYLEVNARKPLVLSGDQMAFRDQQVVAPTANYALSGANSSTRVWDVTNAQVPVQLSGALSGGTLSFSREANTVHEFAVLNSSNVPVPVYKGTVANQNLHGTSQVESIIVTAPEFLSQAERLAEYHRTHDNMSVVVATTQQVYNEFGSGAQDISAIRDFARMLYKRAGADTNAMPRYLTLFGGASYDYKDRLPDNSNYVPVFESRESSNTLNGYSTDDFYGFLDDNEYIENSLLHNTMDIGVGRIPARNVADADAVINKIVNYKSSASLGPWRLATTIVADNADGAGNHMQDAEDMASNITHTTDNLYNENKIYLDAITTISTPAGARCPNANAAISDRIFKGTFLVNYSGHGNTQVWTDERILTQDDFSKWTNFDKLPFMVTATCDYGQFDHPEYVSAAERLVLLKGGGVIVIFTTTAAVYASYNNPLNAGFLNTQLKQKSDGTWYSFGDASRIAKNAAYSVSVDPGKLANYHKFALLGDPALQPNFPEYFVHLDSIIETATGTRADTVKALGGYRIAGHVSDNAGNVLNGFNGMLAVSFFDKARKVATITALDTTFDVQDNIVYKGNVSVSDGRFSFSFIAPKDINYYFGTGKISTYAQNGETDAAGVDTSIKVGGYSDYPNISDNPPIVKPYINDTFFKNGGVTGANTSLFVDIYSETGINVTGNKLGHDMTAVLDGDVEHPYILNDYYETAPNTYQKGYVSFPVTGIANGRHSIRVKAWDVNNNSGEGTVDFVVVDGKVMEISNLMNYPNPFGNTTHFVFEHNHPEEKLDVKINIYNPSGQLVKEIRETFTPSGSRSGEITWDGTDNWGTRLASGVYVYRLIITTDGGYMFTAYQKMVISR